MKTDLTNAECEEMLSQNYYGHLGCVDGEEPYVVPITYLYKDGFMYGFSTTGHKLDLLRKNSRMCIQVDHVVSGDEWQSVICWGFFEEVLDPKSAQDIKLMLGEEFGQVLVQEGKQPVSPLVKNLHKEQGNDSIVYRMKPYRITGKSEKL